MDAAGPGTKGWAADEVIGVGRSAGVEVAAMLVVVVLVVLLLLGGRCWRGLARAPVNSVWPWRDVMCLPLHISHWGLEAQFFDRWPGSRQWKQRRFSLIFLARASTERCV